MLKNIFWQYLAEKSRWGHKNFRIKFSHDTIQHRIIKFEIGVWGYLTIVNLLYPLNWKGGEKSDSKKGRMIKPGI